MAYSKSFGVWIRGSALVLSLALGQGVSLGESMSAQQLSKAWNRCMAAPQPNVAELEAIAAQATERLSADIESGVMDWKVGAPLIVNLRSHLTPAAKARLATAITKALGAERLAQMRLGEARLLKKIQTAVEDERADKTMSLWAVANDSWQTMDPLKVLGLAGELSGSANAVGRQRMVAFLDALASSDAAKIRAFGLGNWHVMTELLLDDASGQQKASWAKAVVGAYSDPEVLASLRYGQLLKMDELRSRLGYTASANLMAKYVLQSQKWRELPPDQLADLLRRLGGPGGPEVQSDAPKARKLVMALIESRFLVSPAEARKIKLGLWGKLIDQLDGDDQARRTDWAQKISAAYGGDDETLAAMSSTDMMALVKVVALLDRKVAGSLAWGWVERAQERKDVTFTTLLRMTGRALEADSELDASRTKLLEALEARWSQQALKEPLTQQEAMAVAGLLLVRGQGEKFKAWLSRTYDVAMAREEAQPAQGINHLFLLFDYMMLAEMTGHGQEYPALGRMVARLARQGKLDFYGARIWGKAISGSETLGLVSAELTDGSGRPRLKVAELVTWAQKQNKTLDAWRGALDKRIEASGDGDVKALWLLARGEAQAVASDEYDATRKREWLDKALAAAQSEDMKLRVLEAFVFYFRQVDRPALGVSMLESVSGQLSAEGLLRLRLWQGQLDDRARHAASRLADQAEKGRLVRDTKLLEHYRTSLRRARSDGDQAAVERLEAAIAELSQ